MSRRATGWTCRRVSQSIVCGHRNRPRIRNCAKCGKPRALRRQPTHLRALDLGYDAYIAINGGEVCGICGRPPIGRRLCRDHDHKTGRPRGLLCSSCNRALIQNRYGAQLSPRWLRAAADYLEQDPTKEPSA